MYILDCKHCKTHVEMPDAVYERQSQNWSSTVRDGLCLGCLRDCSYKHDGDEEDDA